MATVNTMSGTQDLSGQRKLVPSLSPLGAWAMGVGSAIGWGSLVVTGSEYLLEAGPAGSAAGMILGTVIMFAIARCYASLMARFPNAGGAYTFTRHILGHDFGFITAWFLLLTYLSVLWANATSLPLFAHFFIGDMFRFGHLYRVFDYDVYAGEALLTILAITAVGLLCARGKRWYAKLMVGLVCVMVVATTVCAVVCLVLRTGPAASLQPLVLPDKGLLSQLMSTVLMTPWAYIGFESISHGSEEFAFPRKRVHGLLQVILATTLALYLMLIVMSVCAFPPQYSNWFAYLSDLGNLEGIEAIPPFYTAWRLLGPVGVALLMAVLLALVLSSLIGLTLALSRLFMALARDRLLSRNLAELNSDSVPARAIMWVALVSLPVPFLGRTAIGWIVDITTMGSVIVYGLVSLACLTSPDPQNRTLDRAAGVVGLTSMLVFGLITMLPSLFSEGSLAQETYFLIAVWSVLGFICYRIVLHNDGLLGYGQSIVVWGFFLTLVLFTSTVWLQKADQATMDDTVMGIMAHIVVRDADQKAYVLQRLDEANRSNVRSSLTVTAVFVLALAAMMSDYRYLRTDRERERAALGQVREAAYRDPLTGVKNRNAFLDRQNDIDERIARDLMGDFAVVVCDVNDLKVVNDTHGHQAGDDYLREACRAICKKFKHSPVFRIGGDEFVVILEGSDFRDRDELVGSFDAESVTNLGTGTPVIATAVAVYDPKADYSFHTVFERADTGMYARKKELKELEPEA